VRKLAQERRLPICCPSSRAYYAGRRYVATSPRQRDRTDRSAKTPQSCKATTALILVPTRELADQTSKWIATFSLYCASEIRSLNLAQKTSDGVQRSLLADLPDIVVATPARAAQHIDSNALSLDSLTQLVIDEADLVLSYGYEEDLHTISTSLPKGVRTSLMSATLSTEVDTVRQLFCHDPEILDLDDAKDDDNNIKQMIVR
jgi:ATP-dependent RNA helicase DDX56/DBP9